MAEMNSKLTDTHQRALRRFMEIQSAQRDERMQCLQDRRFVNLAGAQWEGPLGEEFEHKPKLEVNKTAKSRDGIIREYRNNLMEVKFTPRDGSEDDDLASSCEKVYRADSEDSAADEARDNGFQEAVDGGIGAWRLRSKYQDDETEEEDQPQRIIWETIVDADNSVFWDLNCKLQDKSDAKFCYVVSSLTYEEYRERYDDDPANWPKMITQRYFDWLTPAVVYVAEYYEVEWESDTKLTFKGLDGDMVTRSQSELDEDPDMLQTLRATGFKKVDSEKVRKKCIHKYEVSGNAILKDYGYIVGSEIPIISVYGKRVFIDNVERVKGHVREAKDMQRILNMQISNMAELSVMSPVEKPIFTPEQILGHQEMWAEDNIVNRPYLIINPTMDAAGQEAVNGPVGYTKVPNIPPAQAELIRFANENMKDMLGNPDEAGKVISHVTGQMVQAAQQVVDSNAYIYISNMVKAIRREGQIYLSMMKGLYTQRGRKMKALDEKGDRTQIVLKQPVIGPDGKVKFANDMSQAAFDVVVSVGPSEKTENEGAVSTLVQVIPSIQDPETQTVLSLTLLSKLPGNGLKAIREFAKMKLLKQGIGTPTPEQAKQLAAEAQNAKPSPSDQAMMAEAQKFQADAQRAQADLALIAAKTDHTKVESVVALAGIQADKQKAALDEFKTLSDAKLDHIASARDTAESLHGMITDSQQQGPSSGSGQ